MVDATVLLLAIPPVATFGLLEWGLPHVASARHQSADSPQRAVAAEALPEGVTLRVSDLLRSPGTSHGWPRGGGVVIVRTDCFDRFDDAELAALVAHEAGHVVEDHSRVGSVHAALCVGVATATLLYASIAAAVLASLAYTVATAPLYRRISHRHEFAADAHAVAATGPAGTVSLLERLQRRRTEALRTRPAVALWDVVGRRLTTHPTLEERLERTRETVFRP